MALVVVVALAVWLVPKAEPGSTLQWVAGGAAAVSALVALFRLLRR